MSNQARLPCRPAVLALIGAVALSACGRASTGDPVELVAPPAVAALGRLEPGDGVIDLGARPGDRVASLLVAEGERVAAGDILGYLDTHEERAAEHQRLSNLLDSERHRYIAERDYGDATIAEAELSAKQIRSSGPLKIAAQEARVRSLEAQTEAARLDTRRIEGSAAYSEQAYDHQVLLATRLSEELLAATKLLDEMTQDHERSIETADLRVTAARANRERAMQSVAIDALEQQVAAAQARVEQSTLVAPIDGEVLEIETWPGEETGRRPVMHLGATQVMYVTAEVYETDVRWVREGQRVTISSSALPGELFGVVERVGSMIFKNDVLDIDPTSPADSRVVEVRARLDDSDTARRFVHLQVAVRIDTGPVDRTPAGGS